MPRSHHQMMSSLADWRRWSDSRQQRSIAVARAVRRRVRPAPATGPPVLWQPSGTPRVLIVIDKLSPSTDPAVRAPLERLDPASTAVLAPANLCVPGADPRKPVPLRSFDALPAGIEHVLTLGGYLPLAGPARAWALAHGARHNVVQHGMLTPWSPPPEAGDHVLAWSAQDADFWTTGRSDVTTEVVGSQLLWSAARSRAATVSCDDAPVVLGQLHGIELARWRSLAIYLAFCRRTGATYRPHPNERDVISRAQHRALRAAGIGVDHSQVPLTALHRPVVSIFSTGTLEAAHRGLPAWVTHPQPPTWVQGVWRRYGLALWGSAPTRPWANHGAEPARAVADALNR